MELVASIKPYVLRKKWVVNALHLSMAILAHSQGRALINEFLKENYGNLFLRGFAAELRTVFEVCLRESKEEFFFEKKQLDTYFYNTCTRISGHPQKVTDATTRLNKAMVFDFIKDFNRKVVEPFLIYTETTSESLRFIPAVIGLVDTIIAEERFV